MSRQRKHAEPKIDNPSEGTRKKRSHAQVVADADSVVKLYTEHIRNGNAPLSLNGLNPYEKKLVRAAEEELFKELERAGLPFKRRREYHWHSEESKRAAAKKPRKPKPAEPAEPAPVEPTPVPASPASAPDAALVKREQNVQRMLDEIDQREIALARRAAELEIREKDLQRQNAELHDELRKLTSRQDSILEGAQLKAKSIIERAKQTEEQAKAILAEAQSATPEEQAAAAARAENVKARREAESIRAEAAKTKADALAEAEAILNKARQRAAEISAKSAALQAKNLELVRAICLNEDDARKFIALSSEPPLKRDAVSKRLELYSRCYRGLNAWGGTQPGQEFILKYTKYIQGQNGLSVTWAPSDGTAPLASAEAEVLLRVLVNELASFKQPETGTLEISYLPVSDGPARRVLRVLLPGEHIVLSHYKATPDAIARYSIGRACAEVRANYPEKIGWRGTMNGGYRYVSYCTTNGCFVLSFAASYNEKSEASGVQRVFAALLTALSQFAAARGEVDAPLTSFKSAAMKTVADDVNEQFENLTYPELQAWNAWRTQFKPTLWRAVQPRHF